MRLVAGKIGIALKSPKIVREDICVAGCDERRHLDEIGTCTVSQVATNNI